jgi:hypothetical protein
VSIHSYKDNILWRFLMETANQLVGNSVCKHLTKGKTGFKQKTGRWIMSRIVIVMLIYLRHKPIDSINLLGSQWRRNVFPVRYGQTYRS